MNTKLSGAQLVLVPITRLGANFLPLVENLRGRVIKFIVTMHLNGGGLDPTSDLKCMLCVLYFFDFFF